jgi:hypothetical protein
VDFGKRVLLRKEIAKNAPKPGNTLAVAA